MISSEVREISRLARVSPDVPIASFSSDTPCILKSVLRAGDVFVDIGAKNGVGSALIGAQIVGPGGCVIALEPNTAKFARLLQNVALNRAVNTMCFPVAASDETIHATLFCEIPRGRVAPVGRNIRVQRVDALCAKVGRGDVRLVKIDAPGSELLVLRGMDKLLRADSAPYVLCQASKWLPQTLNENRDALINYMVDHGYTPRQLGPTQIMRTADGHAEARFTLWFEKSDALFFDASPIH